jgi:uncharacterized protein YprB with RNaseH-like and TPR domain
MDIKIDKKILQSLIKSKSITLVNKPIKKTKKPDLKLTQETEDVTEEENFVVTNAPKILYFDIETTDLSGSFGELLMMGYRWHHEEEYHIIRIHDFDGWDKLPIEKRDIYIVKYVSEILSEADVLVGHYSVRFDHRFVQTRCLIHGLPPIPDTAHIDTWQIAKYQMKLNNNRLKTLATALECEEQKSELPIWVWRRSKAHDIESLELMTPYCVQDVKTLFDCTQKLLPIARKMPNWNLLTGDMKLRCAGCGSDDIVKRGCTYTKINTYQRYQCTNCGRWMRGRKTLTLPETERVMY